MHFLVTGASGLVGGRTVEYILSIGGHSVLATDIRPRSDDVKSLPKGSQFFQADLTSIKEVDALYDASERPIDGVIHMGAIPNPIDVDARICHNTNVAASYNMMYTAASRGIKRIVQASSVNATGLAYSDSERKAESFRRMEFGLPLKEDKTPFLPEDPYSELWRDVTAVVELV
jgi:nucleoside-diphosphate-sugar epimerase